MNAATWAAVIVAVAAVLGCMGSILVLSFRVGSLVGKVTSFIEQMTVALSSAMNEINRLSARQERHVEVFHLGGRSDR